MVEIEVPPGFIRTCKQCNNKVAKDVYEFRESQYPLGADWVIKQITAYKEYCIKCRYTRAISEEEYDDKVTASSKECVTCKEVKPISEFQKREWSVDKLNHRCKECITSYHKEWSAKKG